MKHFKKLIILFFCILFFNTKGQCFNTMVEYENGTRDGWSWFGHIDNCFSSGKAIFPLSVGDFNNVSIPHYLSKDMTLDNSERAGWSQVATIGRAMLYMDILLSFSPASIFALLAIGTEYIIMLDICTNAFILAPHEYANLALGHTCSPSNPDSGTVQFVAKADGSTPLTAVDVPFFYHCDPTWEPGDGTTAPGPLKQSDSNYKERLDNTYGYMGEASPYCTNAFGKLVGNNASVTVESGWADGFPGDPKQLVGHALVYYTNLFSRLSTAGVVTESVGVLMGVTAAAGFIPGAAAFAAVAFIVEMGIEAIIIAATERSQHEACTAGPDGKLFDVTGNSAGQGFFELIGYYRFDSGSGKVQLCVAAPYTLFPVNIGCTYVPPPVELGEIPNFGAADDTRCVYFGSGRSDLKSLGLNISQSGSPDQGNPKSISNFLMSDMHITSTVVGCILDLLDKVFISAGDQGSTFFANIQKNLKSIVLAALVLYVCLVGIKIMTSGGSLRRGDYIMFAVKFALVSYFALGNAWFEIDDKGNKVGIYYGITDGAQQIASYFMEAQNMSDPLGHCRYQYGGDQVLSQRNIPATGSIKPTAGSTDAVKMTVWDMIDCRIISYLNMGTCNYSFAGLIAIWSITALIICSGIGFILCIAMFVYSYMLLKIIFKFVHIFILSMFVITILVLVSPIMITFALFNYTKGIFDSWFKMLLGYIIYPGLHFAFIALMLATFDNIYFGGLKMDPESPSIFQQCQTLGASNTPICAIANNIVQGAVSAGEIEVIAGIITNNPSAVSAGISPQGSGAAALNSSMKDMCDMNIGSIVKGLYETTDLWLLGSFTSMSSSVVEALFLTMLKLALMAFLFFMLMNSISTFFASLTGVESMDSMAKGDLSGGFKAAFSFGATAAFKAPFAIASALSKSGGKSDDKDKTMPRTPGPDK